MIQSMFGVEYYTVEQWLDAMTEKSICACHGLSVSFLFQLRFSVYGTKFVARN